MGGVTHFNPQREDNYIIMLVNKSYRGITPKTVRAKNLKCVSPTTQTQSVKQNP